MNPSVRRFAVWAFWFAFLATSWLAPVLPLPVVTALRMDPFVDQHLITLVLWVALLVIAAASGGLLAKVIRANNVFALGGRWRPIRLGLIPGLFGTIGGAIFGKPGPVGGSN
nr:hypothetical protein [Pseudoclavibacter sp. Marseille-Q3772]